MISLRNLSNTGVAFVASKAERRNIRLTNNISLLAAFAVALLLGAQHWRFHDLVISIWLAGSAFLFFIPLWLNRLGFVFISRLVLCWIPALLIFTVTIFALRTNDSSYFQSSDYVGMRLLLLITSCFPFLVFSTRPTPWLLSALLSPVLSILLFDPILNFFGVGYWQMGLRENSYDFNAVRALVASLIIGGSCYSLKRLVEKGDEQNEALINELATKNRIIQQQANAQLLETSSRLALATQAAGIGIWEWSYETNRVIWDEQMHLLFGLPYNLNQAIDWRSYLHPDDWREVEDKVNQAIKNSREFSTEFRILLPDGGIRHLYTFGNVYPSPDKSARMIGVCWDITERKMAEEQLLQSKANLYATINTTSFSVWSINQNYQLLYCNNPFKNSVKQLFGVEVREGQSILQLTKERIRVEEFSENWLGNYQRALAGESFEVTEKRGNRHFKYSLNPIIENATVTGVSVFGEETTELKRKERELMDANRQIGELRLVALRSVMNPHFIFNSLNSIQYFILENDQVNAVNYLSTFSKLIRGILNNSISNKIRLTEELEQLNHYVSLELLRFENKFDFILQVNPSLDVEDIEIPSMLLQPYVENAILHGLYNKLDHGTLKVAIRAVGHSILYKIEDDGVGREAAMNFRRRLQGHKSMGTALTEERLKLINAQSDASLKIIDLEREGKPAGTKVQIWIKE